MKQKNRNSICKACGKDCHLKRNLKIHVLKCPKKIEEKPEEILDDSNVTRKYMCQVCEKLLQTNASYNRHFIAQHSGIKPFKCEICGYSSGYKDCLNKHKLNFKGDARVNCNLCKKKFVSSKCLHFHNVMKHNEKPRVGTRKPTVTSESNDSLDTPIKVPKKINCGKAIKKTLKHILEDDENDDILDNARENVSEDLEGIEILSDNSSADSSSEVEMSENSDFMKIISPSLNNSQKYVNDGDFDLNYEEKPFVCKDCGAYFVVEAGLIIHREKKHNSQGKVPRPSSVNAKQFKTPQFTRKSISNSGKHVSWNESLATVIEITPISSILIEDNLSKAKKANTSPQWSSTTTRLRSKLAYGHNNEPSENTEKPKTVVATNAAMSVPIKFPTLNKKYEFNKLGMKRISKIPSQNNGQPLHKNNSTIFKKTQSTTFLRKQKQGIEGKKKRKVPVDGRKRESLRKNQRISYEDSLLEDFIIESDGESDIYLIKTKTPMKSEVSVKRSLSELDGKVLKYSEGLPTCYVELEELSSSATPKKRKIKLGASSTSKDVVKKTSPDIHSYPKEVIDHVDDALMYKFCRMGARAIAKILGINVVNTTNLKCSICWSVFRNIEKKMEHIKIAHNLPQECKTCLRCFKTGGQLERHFIGQHLDRNIFMCKFCEERFNYRDSLFYHVSRVHPDNVPRYKCSYCSASFIHKTQFHRHEYSHTQGKKYSCKDCNIKYQSSKDLNKHMIKIHQNDVDSTKVLGQYSSSGIRSKPNKVVIKLKEYNCTECKAKFNNLGSFKRHTAKCHKLNKDISTISVEKNKSIKSNQGKKKNVIRKSNSILPKKSLQATTSTLSLPDNKNMSSSSVENTFEIVSDLMERIVSLVEAFEFTLPLF